MIMLHSVINPGKENLSQFFTNVSKRSVLYIPTMFYNKEVRILIKQRKKLKSQLKKSSIASSYYHWLPKQIEHLDQLIDKKISDFNINIIRSFITN